MSHVGYSGVTLNCLPEFSVSSDNPTCTQVQLEMPFPCSQTYPAVIPFSQVQIKIEQLLLRFRRNLSYIICFHTPPPVTAAPPTVLSPDIVETETLKEKLEFYNVKSNAFIF